MAEHKSGNEEHNHSLNKGDESFEKLLHKKLETEQKLEKKFRRVVTLMQSDIKGSTEFQQNRGDIEAEALLALHSKLLNPILSRHGGKVISDDTDGALVAFENAPEKAVKAAIEFMQVIHKHNERIRNKLHIRIAMNHGPVIVKGNGQLKGLTVSTTARIEQCIKELEKQNEEIAKTNLIVISGSLYDEIKNSENIICRWVDRMDAKGVDKPLNLYRIVWNTEQEQIIFNSIVPSKQTRGPDTCKPKGGVTALANRNIFVVEIAKETNYIKICGYEKAEQEQKTVRHYEEQNIDFELIEEQIHNIISMLNQSTQRGKISKEILNNLKSGGKCLYDKLFSKTIRNKLSITSSEDLIISIDDNLVHIPWELLYDGTSFLSLRFNMGRVLRTRQTITETALRPMGLPLRVLVLSDPRNNLKSACKEGYSIRDKLAMASNLITVNVKTGNINSNYVKEKIHNFDIVHYAGHSDYDSANPSRSSWLLKDRKLTAEEIKEMGRSKPMPALILSNACHSGQTDKWKISDDSGNKIYGMANAFLLSGVHHYIGTFWEVLDEPSSHFATVFYEFLSNGKTVGNSLRLARKELINKYGEETLIWASYMLYGDPSFYYIHLTDQKEIIPPVRQEMKCHDIDLKDDDVSSSRKTVAPEIDPPSKKTHPVYLMGGIAVIILITLVSIFLMQTKQSEMSVSSVQSAKPKLFGLQAGGDQEPLNPERNEQKQITAVGQRDKRKEIDALVTELAKRYREGAIKEDKRTPVDEWVSRPLVVSLFHLNVIGTDNKINQDVILNQISEFFGTSNRVKLVDRELIDKLLEELKLGSSELADSQTALKIGKLVGARYIASGNIFSVDGKIKLSLKLIETETTSIVATKSRICKKEDLLPVLTLSVCRELLDALISKFPLRARIIGFFGNEVVINIGKNQGMEINTKFNVYEEKKVEGSNAVVKKKVGMIEIREVDENVSTGIALVKTKEFLKNMKLDEAL